MPKEWFVVDRADFVGLSDEALEMLTETQDLVRDEVPAADRARLSARAARRERHRLDVLRRDARDRVPRRRATTTSRRCGCASGSSTTTCARRSRRATCARSTTCSTSTAGSAATSSTAPSSCARSATTSPTTATMARTYGMVFAPQLVLFDLGYVTRRAYERASPAARRSAEDGARRCRTAPATTSTRWRSRRS